jgi:hypothetical protein
VGTPITTNTPSITGIVSSYTIRPALPDGLQIDATTGRIGGTPTAVSAQTTYTVTATNPGGSTTAQVQIKVLSGPTTLVNLGHSAAIVALCTNATRVLSEDGYGHWVLWDYASADTITSGNGAVDVTSTDPYMPGIALAGPTMGIFDGTNVNIYSASDGRLTVAVPGGEWFRLATDGSYVLIGSQTGLMVYSAAGTLAFSHSGDYRSGQNVYAAPTQIQVERGNFIENIAFPSGSSTLTPLFAGNFQSWFTDGHRFLTVVGDSVLTYSANGALQATLPYPPNAQALIGQGNWISIVASSATGSVLSTYAVGSTTPTQVYAIPAPYNTVAASGLELAFFDYGSPEINVIDMSGSTPTNKNYMLPSPLYVAGAFAANSASSWIVACNNSVILDGTTLNSKPRLFNYGRALSIVASSNTAAIATESGRILIYDLRGPEQKGVIESMASKLAISADSTVLAFADLSGRGPFPPSDPDLHFYSLPSLTLMGTVGTPGLLDFSLSDSGNEVGLLIGNMSEVMHRDGSERLTLASAGPGAPILSPDGTLAAVSNAPADAGIIMSAPQLTIYKNGLPIASPWGAAEGWIDSNHLLVAAFDFHTMSYWNYSNSAVLDASGAIVTAFTFNQNQLPAIANPSFIQGGSVYDPVSNAIYSLTTANVTFQGSETPQPGRAVGAAGTSTIAYQSKNGAVRIEPFQ